MVKIAIVFYSMYGHIAAMAEAVKEGVEEAGGKVDMYQIPETLSEDVLTKMHAPAKTKYPVVSPADLLKYDAFIFGTPTRYGNMTAQWKTFIDATGQIWSTGGYQGKYCGLFTSSGTQGGGQETTILQTISTLAHHGIIYVPLGYKHTFPMKANFNEIHGGSPWGAGTFAAPDGSRQPTKMELDIAKIQGKTFYETVSRVKFD